MGCTCSIGPPPGQRIRKPAPWQHTEPITRAALNRMREEFWDTQPHYGGSREIWDALKAAADTNNMRFARAVLDGADIIANIDMTICYDVTGVQYLLPVYVLSEPTNLIPN